MRVDPEVGRRQQAKLAAVKASRDDSRVRTALAGLERAARGTENLMPRILDAVRAYATLGEISDVLRGVFGEYRPAQIL